MGHWSLRRDLGLPAVDAVLVAERVVRGGDGVHGGLGRERVYLEGLVRVKRAPDALPSDEAVLSAGQISASSLGSLRPLLVAGAVDSATER